MKDESTAVSLLERLKDGPQDNLEDRFAREAGKYSECPSKSKVRNVYRRRHRFVNRTRLNVYALELQFL